MGPLTLLGCLLWLSAGARAALPHEPAGEVERGRALIASRGCLACHAVPGIRGMRGNVGPPLDHMARRAYIAGVLANTPDNMQRWLRNPPAVDPLTAMPDLGLRPDEAKAIAAYLYTLD